MGKRDLQVPESIRSVQADDMLEENPKSSKTLTDSRTDRRLSPIRGWRIIEGDGIDKWMQQLSEMDVNIKSMRVNEKDINKVFARAATRDHASVVGAMLKHPLIRNEHYYIGTVLVESVRSGAAKSVACLLKVWQQKLTNHRYPPDPYSNPLKSLSLAAGMGHVAALDVLLRDGRFDVNALSGRSCWSPLMEAAARGSSGCVQLILQHPGLRVNKVASKASRGSGNTAMHVAASYGDAETLAMLCDDTRVDVNARNHYGHTPLTCAIAKEEFENVAVLVRDARVDLNVSLHKDGHSVSILRLADQCEDKRIPKLIKSEWIDI